MRILIVDDSPVARLLLRAIFEAEGFLVKEAATGEEALKVLLSFTPDIITMDVHMPGMDGYETTEHILERYALPVVVITASANAYASATAMRALEAGALAVLDKPRGPDADDFNERVSEIVRTLRSMAQVRIVRRPRKVNVDLARQQTLAELVAQSLRTPPQLVAIAASAGGPAALKSLLERLQPPQPWPLVLVQHIATGFLPSFRDWLATLTHLPVLIAEDGSALEPGRLYLAPDGCHLGVTGNCRVALDGGPPEELVRPSANFLFRSVARHFGAHAIGIQLSGMGRDGAEGLAAMRQRGALTLVQEPSSAMIDSMPQAAIGLDAARQVLTPDGMSTLLNRIAEHLAAKRE
ncbi:chemotaxis protein CheB [Pseudomonas sp. 30_B]|uniref:chemotaxis protein CheB n=1 Tax=Pseudomonas sp. 30_B TaxID=2813575 RepID=UPI001A9E35D7|nr:chemotaxis protein CheB [Pseudomonas sp. 30_B]